MEAGLGQSSLSQVAGGAAGVVRVDGESGEEVAKNKMTMIMIVKLQPLIIDQTSMIVNKTKLG